MVCGGYGEDLIDVADCHQYDASSDAWTTYEEEMVTARSSAPTVQFRDSTGRVSSLSTINLLFTKHLDISPAFPSISIIQVIHKLPQKSMKPQVKVFNC